ncbi:MAG TPA: glucose-6-phosphate isomerase family protein [Candidatus Paceibacterota bacterium]|nr:glucose-6-phosphate isomerase family protein [Candidatus Paceibacterota bacterium]
MAGNIKFHGKVFRPDIRKIGDLESVISDKKWLDKSVKNKPAYFMYRGLIGKSGLRYDITIMPFRLFGQELPKTLGHYHSFAGATKYRYPEVYEVLGGNAVFLLQKLSSGNIKKIFIIYANKNDKVIVPPGYGHITMNAGPGTLKLANWMAMESSSDYGLIVRKGGGAYFALKSDGKIKWVKNKRYGTLPKPEYKKGTGTAASFLGKGKLIGLSKDISKLEFLKNPEKFPELWKKLEN